jgi:hypothetical protein
MIPLLTGRAAGGGGRFEHYGDLPNFGAFFLSLYFGRRWKMVTN